MKEHLEKKENNFTYNSEIELEKIINEYFNSNEHKSSKYKFNRYQLDTALRIMTDCIEDIVEKLPPKNSILYLKNSISPDIGLIELYEKLYEEKLECEDSIKRIRKYYNYSNKVTEIYEDFGNIFNGCEYGIDNVAYQFANLLSSKTIESVNNVVKELTKELYKDKSSCISM